MVRLIDPDTGATVNVSEETAAHLGSAYRPADADAEKVPAKKAAPRKPKK